MTASKATRRAASKPDRAENRGKTRRLGANARANSENRANVAPKPNTKIRRGLIAIYALNVPDSSFSGAPSNRAGATALAALDRHFFGICIQACIRTRFASFFSTKPTILNRATGL